MNLAPQIKGDAPQPLLEPSIEEVLSEISPQTTQHTAHRMAQIGEMKQVLRSIAVHSEHGCTRIMCNIHYSTTIHELTQRGFELELYDKQPGWVISWEEEPPSLTELLSAKSSNQE